MSCNQCTCKAKGIYFQSGAAIAGTSIPQSTIDPDGDDLQFKNVSVINDTDQDIKFEFMDSEGNQNDFIVPVSIKGFTHNVKCGYIDLTTVKVYSLHASSPAVGNISCNFRG